MQALYVIGFDPGGDKAFGWSVLAAIDSKLSLSAFGTCSNAPDAMAAARLACPLEPVAAAVDAPLFWAQAGDRNADRVVRQMVCNAGGFGGTVGHVNSLRGACLVQGILVTRIALEVWPAMLVTEAHPKALLIVSSAAREFAASSLAGIVSTEHERDAAIAAFTAYSFSCNSSGWRDLVADERGPYFPLSGPVAYWFPKTRS